MFKKISKIYQGLKSLSSADIVSSINSSLNSSSFSNFNRDNTQSILQKLGGYQYFSADIIAKQIASQKLRLYAKNGERRSKYSNSTEKIIVKNVPVSKYKLDYFRGENKELCHDSLRYKTLTAENGIVEILDHPALDLINSINSYSNKWEFLYTLALSMQFYGNSYFLKVRNTDNSVAEMWLAPTQYMKIIQGKTLNNFIDHYEYGNNFGSPQIYDPNDICDFKMPGVGNSQVYGVSKLEVTWKYINLLDSSLAFQKAICDNVGRPDFLLVAENAKSNSEDLKRTESKWNDKFYGPDQAGKMSVLPGKVKAIILPRSEFSFDNDLPLIKAIGRGFGLPEYKFFSSSIKANDSQQEKDFMKETIDSYLTLVEEVLNQNLLSEYQNNDDLFFAFDPVIQENKEQVHKENIDYIKYGIRTPNEVRLSIGDEPEGPEADKLYFQGRQLGTISSNRVINPDKSKNYDLNLQSQIDNIKNNSSQKPIEININNIDDDEDIDDIVDEEKDISDNFSENKNNSEINKGVIQKDENIDEEIIYKDKTLTEKIVDRINS